MKHIKKRFLIEVDSKTINKEALGVFSLKIDESFDEKILSNSKKSIAYIETENSPEKLIGGFIHNIRGKNYILPVPDPTLIYFHNAQINLKKIEEFKSNLLDKLSLGNKAAEPAINELYNYYGITSGVVIFLFTSIESFINQQIPDSYIFTKSSNKKTEIFNKEQIQEFIDFKTKITEVLPDATKKNFFSKRSSANQMIWNLKEFRDGIIHTKQEGNPLRYDTLIKKCLTFDYKKTLEAVATFMNFYKENYIIECDCGVDF